MSLCPDSGLGHVPWLCHVECGKSDDMQGLTLDLSRPCVLLLTLAEPCCPL